MSLLWHPQQFCSLEFSPAHFIQWRFYKRNFCDYITGTKNVLLVKVSSCYRIQHKQKWRSEVKNMLLFVIDLSDCTFKNTLSLQTGLFHVEDQCGVSGRSRPGIVIGVGAASRIPNIRFHGKQLYISLNNMYTMTSHFVVYSYSISDVTHMHIHTHTDSFSGS